MSKPSIIAAIMQNIMDAKSINDLKLIKNQLLADMNYQQTYNYTDVLLLSLAIEFRAYTLTNQSNVKTDPETEELQHLYKAEIEKVSDNSLVRINKIFDKKK